MRYMTYTNRGTYTSLTPTYTFDGLKRTEIAVKYFWNISFLQCFALYKERYGTKTLPQIKKDVMSNIKEHGMQEYFGMHQLKMFNPCTRNTIYKI